MPPKHLTKRDAYNQNKTDFTLEESLELEELKRNDLYSFIMLDIYPYWQESIDGEWRLGKLHEEGGGGERNHKRSIILAPRDHLKSFSRTIGLTSPSLAPHASRCTRATKTESRVARK